jgi:signal transduction histidine kinase
MRILSVDDNAGNLYLIEVIARAHGHQVVSARNGVEALERLASATFDLIVSDILMPGMDGFQLCRNVKNEPRFQRIPFVFYTATYTTKKDEELGLALGASRFVVKPVEPAEFLAIIEQVVKEGEAHSIPVADIDLDDAGRSLSLYNERLVRKLEQKIEQLEAARAQLAASLEEREREIEQRKRAEAALARSEEQLRQAQKLECVGRLAGGIVHDFNNLLTVINGYSDLLSRLMPHDDPSLEAVLEIGKAGQRASALTRRLLGFTRQQAVHFQPLDLNRVVADTLPLVVRLVGEDITIVTGLHPHAVAVHADPLQLEQVLMNLAVNSRDAMPRGGRLAISTGISADGAAAVLSVADNGEGMSDETRRRIFEPFFTTKEPEKGTGLGLAIVQRIVTQCGGHVEVESAPGQGAAFHIRLPLSKATPESQHPDGAAADLRGRETILVVEDQAEVRNYIAAVLHHYGYRVLQAAHAAEAVELYRRRTAPIHLVLTDLVMPAMSGHELAEQLRQSDPAVRILLISGCAEAETAGAGLLAKPFSPNQLAAKVRSTLGG